MYKPLEPQYQWITDHLSKANGMPVMVTIALGYYGLKETKGPGNTPEIIGWARHLGPGVAAVYKADSIPWCGLFMAYVAKKAGKPVPASPLWARSWATWGSKSPAPSFGDVGVFERGEPGGDSHVGIILGQSSIDYLVLGGNQGDAVSIRWLPIKSLIAARRYYEVGAPITAVPITLKADGRANPVKLS